MKRFVRAAIPVLLSFAAALAGIGSASAQAPGPASARKTVTAVSSRGPIRIDGVLSEPDWSAAGIDGFTQTDPLDGQPATEETRVWVAFDRNSLYVAARLSDKDPAGIVSRLGRRDEEVSSDWFYFAIDPYLDRRSGYFFGVNPAGSIIDGTIFNDESTDETWDGIWQSAARVDGQGWTVEIRVPFDQLRFKRRDAFTWGVNFLREIRRKNESVWFAWRPKEESGMASRFADLVGVRDIDPGNRLELSPYATGKALFAPVQPGNPFRTGRDYSGNAGFDFKAGLRSDLTLDLSVNPDFGQVEVDPAVINISDQETYYQEKRPFFIEGANLFNFGRGGPNTARSAGWTDPGFFYSRRIGRQPQGSAGGPGYADTPEWATILGAAKITGKLGADFSLGFVSAVTAEESAEVQLSGLPGTALVPVEPLTYYGVGRGLREFGAGRSGLGFIATAVLRDFPSDSTLDARLGREAYAFGADGWTFLDKARVWSLSGWAGGTLVRGSQAAILRLQRSSLHYFQRPDVDYVRVDPDATSLGGWAGRVFLNKQQGNFVFNSGLAAMSPGFEANDLGYHTRGDVINGHVQAGYQTFHPGRILRRWIATLTYYQNRDFGGHRTGEYWILDGEAQLLNYWTIDFGMNYEPPKTSHYLTRGGPMAFYPSGATIEGGLSTDNRKAVVFRFSASYRNHDIGSFNWSFSGGVSWKPSPNFTLSVSPSFVWRYSMGQWVTSVPDALKTETYGVRYVLSDIIQKTLPVEVRLSWTFTPRLSFQAYLQPYIGTGDYREFKELRASNTFDFDFYGRFGDSTISTADGVYTVDPDGAEGAAKAFGFRDPDFNLKSLRGTIVLRWEYRPGSMLYFVWTQRRSDASHPGDFDFERDWADLWKAPGDNIFLVKFSYRFEF